MEEHKQINTSVKLQKFAFSVQGGMLEALGINMYSTLGKSLVEFIANAYDAEASEVRLSIPFSEIEQQRSIVRENARKDIQAGNLDNSSILTLPLPENLEVIIKDNGHGMTPQEVNDKFLPINRNRRLNPETNRETIHKSENNKRQVMGRKGLGKLAGFGASEIVIIRTKKKGDDFFTEFKLDYNALKESMNINHYEIIPSYKQDSQVDSQWTEVILKRLKCDAVKYGQNTLKTTITDNFYGIQPTDFAIYLNNDLLESEAPDYEFFYPQGARLNDFAEKIIHFEELSEIKFNYLVMFRKRGDNLKVAQRGARIYCNKRLAAGPSLFDMDTGMHGFHNISYMECIVNADSLDELGIDLINTNRTQLKQDNEVVSKFIKEIENLMKEAIAEHARYRESVAEIEIRDDEKGSIFLQQVDNLPRKTRGAAKQFIKKLAATAGVNSTEFRELTPLFLASMNAGEVLMKLIDLKTDPKTIRNIMNTLNELTELEKSDALKLYRARKNGIVALKNLIKKGNQLWQKKGIESELHNLLKTCPWLISPEYNNFLTSDNSLEIVYSRIAKDLSIDSFADDKDKDDEQKRPDLVFLMGNNQKSSVVIVELKSPTIPLEKKHLEQLEFYMEKTSDWLKNENIGNISIRGILIGAKSDTDSKAQGVYMLNRAIEKAGPTTMWRVFGLEELLNYADSIYSDEIKAFEEYLKEETDSPLVNIES